ncbi:MAG: tRNA1(Val) (adenine(37)-N6)-methyltransferase [Lachnospiraceae bacterium]|nr:tRNA1(Val) (adenine(37)-N6)-methyltransferase [Lachnospiraceae bacterium]
MTENERQALVYEGERVDDLERNNLKIIQDPSRFCFGMDAVLLSGFASVKEGEQAIDLGTGNGIIPILLYAKTKGEHFAGLEIQPENVDIASRSVKYNGLEDKIDIIEGDIKTVSQQLGRAKYDVVTCNPPYMIGQHGIANPESAKAIARHELLCTFEDVAREAAALLKPQGRFYLVHRPFRLAELIVTLTKYKLEPKRMRLVHPFIDKEPNMVLLEAVRGGKSRMLVEPPLIVYKEQGVYTEEIYTVYGY